MSIQPWATGHKKTDSPFPGGHQLPVTTQLKAGSSVALHSPCLSVDWLALVAATMAAVGGVNDYKGPVMSRRRIFKAVFLNLCSYTHSTSHFWGLVGGSGVYRDPTQHRTLYSYFFSALYLWVFIDHCGKRILWWSPLHVLKQSPLLRLNRAHGFA